MKKNLMNRALLVCLALFMLAASFVPNGTAQAEGADLGAASLQRIGEIADPSKPPADKLVLAVIGDYGDCYRNCEHEQAVADLVHSWNPGAILTVGDNSYRLGTVDEVEADQKPYWTDIAAGRFFPIYGNHDYGNGCSPDSLKPSLDYFKIPASYVAGFGNGLVDFINPDVNCNMSSQTGAQPAIFDAYKNTVNESSANAKWVLTGGHQPIFSSGQAGNNLNRRWLMTPGVDLLLQGHDHHAEHIVTPEGYNEVITGNGGQGLTPLFPPVPGSMFRDNSEYGAVRLTITPETLTVDYVNIPGTVVYSFTLKKDPFTKKAYVASRTDWQDPNPNPGDSQATGDKTVSMAFGEDNEYKNGLDWFPYESGPAHEIEIDGRTALQLDRSAFGTANNLYMKIDDERMYGGPYKATASIEYRSPVAGSFVLQYESAATGATYQSTARVSIKADQVDKWQTVTLDMPGARFTNRQNGGADMRIVAANKLPLIISSMKIDATPEKLPVTLWAIRIQTIDPMKAGETSQTVVKATYSDFSTELVTEGLTFTSSDTEVASVDKTSGMITALRPGDTVITAEYGGVQDQYHLTVKDSVPPTTTLTLDGTLLRDGSYLHEAIVRLAAVDDYSGVEKIEYSLDRGNTWNLYTGSFALNQDAILDIQFHAIDKAGNVELPQTQTVKVTSATIANLRASYRTNPSGKRELRNPSSATSTTWRRLSGKRSYSEIKAKRIKPPSLRLKGTIP
ncbi:hypothetical protein SD70_04245 [Gordoniibacillus kamchatkensis]|uniref:BIG2 domain-containing protein n=1 Tax=Gordoniibacillus kamchatkensis TaxID=1590651 RepID=A0ABR5ALE2_9BACL|nr:metallophosphoesterase [Paenibacillus sp. VKM B-2647]KIL41836.1 hypothetical protein SD70_04245 [Paenibacillus sp. VKM B-2647]